MPEEVEGARQWGVNDFAYLGPCPNPFPADSDLFDDLAGAMLFNDSYSFTIYALDTATLGDLPTLDPEVINETIFWRRLSKATAQLMTMRSAPWDWLRTPSSISECGGNS